MGINGFGRIGRLFLRASLTEHVGEIDITAINDPQLDPQYVSYLIKHDSVYRDPGFEVSDVTTDSITLNGKMIRIFGHREANQVPWKQCGVDIVAECSGVFTSSEKARGHLVSETNGANRVVLSAPAKDEVTPTFVMGVNESTYDPSMTIVSNASCTTNCLAPLMKIVHDNFGVEEALMTTIHALTNTQSVVDAPSGRDYRGGRSALNNIIPASTGAALATTKVLPELTGKFTGMAFRVPVQDVSVVDVTIRLTHPAQSIDAIAEAFRYAPGMLGRVVGVATDQVVSSDFVGDGRSCILDVGASILLNPHFVKLVAYYDNEWAYALRMVSV